MKNYLPKFVFIFVILAICGLPVFGQVTPTGSISGAVTDPQGAVVPNATVTVNNKSNGVTRTATTSDSGAFTIPQLPTGVYTVTVQATSGFKKSQVTDVKVDGLMAQVEMVVSEPVRLVAIVTRDAVEELGLKKGMAATAIVKSTNVIIQS